MTINNRRQHSYFSPRQSGSTHFVIILVLALVLGFLFIPRIVEKHALAASFKVFSGTSGYCLDDHDDATANNAAVDTWKCNGSAAQSWAVNYATNTNDDN